VPQVHYFTYTSVATPATCTEKGYTTYTYDGCGDSYVDDYTDALGHDLITQEAKVVTCTENGWIYDICLRCDYTSYEEFSALGHNEGVNGSCTVCKEFIGNVRCDAAALALEGEIGIVFYYRFTDAVLADTNAYVKFTYNTCRKVGATITTTTNTVEFPISVMTLNTKKGYDRYRVVCGLAAQDMFQKVKAEVVYTIDGEAYTSNAIEYGVETYYKNMYNKYSQELDDLLDSLLAYGDSARIYFQGTEAETSKYTANLKSVTAEDLSDYASTSEGTFPSGVKNISASLILDSKTSIKVYIDGDVSNCEVTVDGVSYEPTLIGESKYEVVIENIVSCELDHIYTISISNSDGEGRTAITFTYSALTYVRNKLSSDDQNLVQLVCALYYYNQAADAYFK
jgi:archaellum component FlaG (FlaF/FlaG flagellin family)